MPRATKLFLVVALAAAAILTTSNPASASSDEAEGGGGFATIAAFWDVPADHPFLSEITWLSDSGITTGFGDGSFQPSAPVSRQAMAAYLYRFSYDGEPTGCPHQWFPDVAVDNQFCGHIWWLARTGITGGFGDGTFRPTTPVTRQAMAAFLHRYAEAGTSIPLNCDPGRFNDVDAGHPFCGEITWLEGTGITTGFEDGGFHPGDPVSRQAMAAFLERFNSTFGPSDPPLVVAAPPPPPPPPPPPSNPGDTKNCSDFATWQDAQAWHDHYFPHYGDVANLDGDGNGIACESLPGAP